MSAAESLLPPGFASLEPFAGAWAVEGADNRRRRRIESTPAEREAFFEAVRPVLPAALEHLDRKPLASFDAAEKRLMNLLLTFAHVAPAVECLGDDEPRHAIGSSRVTITRATADQPA